MPVLTKGCRFHDSNNATHRTWNVIRKVGEGQSAEVYAVRGTHQLRCAAKTVFDRQDILDDSQLICLRFQYAVKIEREPGVRTLKAELKVKSTCPEFPHYTHARLPSDAGRS